MASKNPGVDASMIRGVRLGLLYAEGAAVTTRLIQERFLVSRAQAKRDLRALRMVLEGKRRPLAPPAPGFPVVIQRP